MTNLDLLGAEVYKKGKDASIIFKENRPYLVWQSTQEQPLQKLNPSLLSSYKELEQVLRCVNKAYLLISYIDSYYRTALFCGRSVFDASDMDLNQCVFSLNEQVRLSRKDVEEQVGGIRK